MEATPRPRRARRPDDAPPPGTTAEPRRADRDVEPDAEQMSLASAAAASRGRSSRSPSRSLIIGVFVALNGQQLVQGPGPHPRREPAAGAGRVRRLLCRVPAARLALEAAPARHRLRDLDPRLDRDHLPVVARQLRRAGQARRRLSRLPAQDQQHRIAAAARSGRSSSSACSTSSPSPCWASPPGTGASATGCRRRSSWSWRSASSSWPSSSIGLFTMRNFGRQIIVRLRFLPHQVLELYDRFEEGVFGALVARQLPGLGVPDRAHLADRGRCGSTSSSRRSGFADVELGLSGRDLRRPHRLAADGRAAQPGRARHRRGRRRRRPDASPTACPLPEATAIALLDRVISVFSVIVFGSIAYVAVRRSRAGWATSRRAGTAASAASTTA